MIPAAQILAKYKAFNPTLAGLMAFYDWMEELGIEVPVLQIIPAQYRYEHVLVETLLNFWTELNNYPRPFTLEIQPARSSISDGCEFNCEVLQKWSEEWYFKGTRSLDWNLAEVWKGRLLLPNNLQCGGEEDNDFVVRMKIVMTPMYKDDKMIRNMSLELSRIRASQMRNEYQGET